MGMRRLSGIAGMLGVVLCIALLYLPAVNAQTAGLAGGAYRVEVQNSGRMHLSTWTLQVSGNQITGKSESGLLSRSAGRCTARIDRRQSCHD